MSSLSLTRTRTRTLLGPEMVVWMSDLSSVCRLSFLLAFKLVKGLIVNMPELLASLASIGHAHAPEQSLGTEDAHSKSVKQDEHYVHHHHHHHHHHGYHNEPG